MIFWLRSRKSLKLLFIAMLLVSEAQAAFVVVVPKESQIKKLSADELVEIFMARSMGTGKRFDLYPIDHKDTALKEEFYRQTAGLSLNSVHAYWSKRVFSGRGRPPATMSNDEIVDVFRQSTDGIAYIRPEQLSPALKVIYRAE